MNAQAWALRRDSAASAVAVGMRSLAIAHRIGFRAGEAQVLNYIGVAYQWSGDQRSASSYFFRALAVADSAGITVEKGYALNNIAAVFMHEGENERALDYAHRSLALQEKVQDKRAIAYAHSRLAEILNASKRYDEAILESQRSYAAWQGLHVTSNAMTAVRDRGLAYEGKGQYADALREFVQIIESDSVSAGTKLNVDNDLARVYLRQREPDKAIAVGLAKLRSDRGDYEIMRYLADAYAMKRDWEHASEFRQREAVLQDSVAKAERLGQMRNLETIFEARQTESANISLREQLRLSRFLAAAIGAVLLLSAYVAFSLFGKRRRQEEVNRLLGEQLLMLQASKAALSASSDALAVSSNLQRAILDNVPDAMWVKGVDRRYTAVNEAFCALVAQPMTEVIGKTVDSFLSAEEVRLINEQETEVFARREPITVERELLLRGESRILDVTITPVLDATGGMTGLTAIARDVTDRKRLEAERLRSEERSRQAQKLESLGVLAAGIAHDFNNLLFAIMGNAELARLDLAPDSPVLESVLEIEHSARRAAELTRQLLAYTGKGPLDTARVDLSAAMEPLTDDMRALVGDAGTLQFDLASDLPPVQADAQQLRQILTNLLSNAADALPSAGGTITVRTEEVRIGGGNLPDDDADLAAGTYAVIEVADTGHGMTADVQRRVFEPFFTTKFIGRGLGLAAVLGIVRAHHGSIRVSSEVGVGSRFRVYLPGVPVSPERRPHDATAAARAMSSGIPADPALKPLVLVVDDEPSVRALAQRLIERAGYRVITASDGVEAVEVVGQHRDAIAVVLLDLLMPRLGGDGALQALREIMPDLPVLLSSGYRDTVLVDRLRGGHRVGFLAKPYAKDELLTAIGAMLKA